MERNVPESEKHGERDRKSLKWLSQLENPRPIHWDASPIGRIEHYLFSYYQQANPTLGFPAQVFGYLGTAPFTVVNASIIIPIILAFANELFNIDATIEERAESRRQARNEQRAKAIEETSLAWNELYRLCNLVIFYDARNKSGEGINEIWSQIAAITSTGTATLNTLLSRLSNLREVEVNPIECVNNVTFFFNVLIASAKSVALFISESYSSKTDQKIVNELQCSLGVVIEATKRFGQTAMLEVLKNSQRLSEPNLSDPEKDEIKKRIIGSITFQRNIINPILTTEVNFNRLLSSVEGPDVTIVREMAKKYKQWRPQNLTMLPVDFTEYQALLSHLGVCRTRIELRT